MVELPKQVRNSATFISGTVSVITIYIRTIDNCVDLKLEGVQNYQTT